MSDVLEKRRRLGNGPGGPELLKDEGARQQQQGEKEGAGGNDAKILAKGTETDEDGAKRKVGKGDARK